ncbi:hypothetical protein EJ110_NYTH27687 [Nymphaea thermarum]|nr:hypothetical protein EJ110_NYTH27687 [Nymphaea thermarum]
MSESSFKMYSFQRGVTFSYDHILFGEGPDTYISLESKPLAPEWYRSWHPTFSRMFPSYIEECGLEAVAAGGMQIVDGNLVHAIAERWNPRTSSFWFPWGEMTILLDEFAEILDLPTPTCDPNETLEKQFLMNPTKGPPRYTHHPHGRTTLLGPYFITDYCADRCMRQFSQRQKMVSVHTPIRAIPEFDLNSPQWTAVFAVARQEWRTQISYTWFAGPVVKKEYAEWWDANRPPSIIA